MYPLDVRKFQKGVGLFDSANQGFGVHSCVPDVNEVNDITGLVIVIYEFEAAIHDMASSVEDSFTKKKSLWRI